MNIATDAEKAVCQAFLRKQEYAVIATASTEGKPSAAVVTYLTDDAWNLYFFTRKHTDKVGNLANNDKIALVIGTGPTSTTIQIDGRAVQLTAEEQDHWMDTFLTHREGFYTTFLKLHGYDFVGYRVAPERIRWLQLREDASQEEMMEVKI